MKIVLQRVLSARVEVDGREIGSIGRGYVILLGITKDDTRETVEKMADKIHRLRIFPDQNGKTNLSAKDIDGDALIISQFTLMADCSSNRPSFSRAADADQAKALYEHFIACCTPLYHKTATGKFAAHMHLHSHNEGPFTLTLEG